MSFVCPTHGPYFPLHTGTSLAICPACAQTQPYVPTRLWQTCPICAGCCTVPADFYSQLGTLASTGREPCRRCNATGTIEQPACGPEPAQVQAKPVTEFH
jgi:hypothetical protein